MSFFQHKLNPFTEFTISLGPAYVERLFDSLLVKGGLDTAEKRNPVDRFKSYIELLNKNAQTKKRKEYTFIQFYIAHFYQQSGKHSTENKEKIQYYENALSHYHSYLELTKGAEESRYYAQWQTGILQDAIHNPWPIVEASLLIANSMDPMRGEAMKKIIHHYRYAREWEAAYLYSSIAKNNFFDRNPIATRRWFIDFDCYNWHVLYTHITICYKLEYFYELEQIYQQLLSYEIKYLSELNNMEVRRIHSLENILHKPKKQIATI